MDNDHICKICGLSKDPNKAGYIHTRIGSDEAPELALCRCKDRQTVIKAIQSRIRTLDLGDEMFDMNTTIDMNESWPVNSVSVLEVDRSYKTEIEVRLSSTTSLSLWKVMETGFFGTVTRRTLEEIGCSKWMGKPFEKICRARNRTYEGNVLKVPLLSCNFMPGLSLNISREYSFEGTINKPQYSVQFEEMSVAMEMNGVKILINSREYETNNKKTYASEIEFLDQPTFEQICQVTSEILKMTETEKSMRMYVDASHMSQARYADHDVLDVSDVTMCSGIFTYKADGMKVYVFSYQTGYVITFTDRALTVIEYHIEPRSELPEDITKTPDIMVAEMMVDGSLIYIDTLALNNEPLEKPREYIQKPVQSSNYRPAMTVRKLWNSYQDMMQDRSHKISSDGYVCIGKNKTVRMKIPTVDLLCKDQQLCSTDATKTVIYGQAHPDMIENGVYELTVTAHKTLDIVTLSKPVRRLIKELPNPPDVVSRSFVSSFKETNSTILYDVVSVSFKMRRMVYNLAKSHAMSYRRVILSVGTGRFQEINEMDLKNFSYIVVDPEIDTERIKNRKDVKSIVKYDVYSSMMVQIRGITSRPGNVLYYKGKFSDFLNTGDILKTITTTSLPSVFSFSLSFCSAEINVLKSNGVPVYGCGYVHDHLPVLGVGKPPVTMKLEKDQYGNSYVAAVFGKSTYNEPIFLSTSVKDLRKLSDVMPEVDSEIDTGTKQILDRAVLLI